MVVSTHIKESGEDATDLVKLTRRQALLRQPRSIAAEHRDNGELGEREPPSPWVTLGYDLADHGFVLDRKFGEAAPRDYLQLFCEAVRHLARSRAKAKDSG
jgi:hypothetical protein